MAPNLSSPSKPKITLTLNRNLVQQIDGFIELNGLRSRSQVVEAALRLWIQEQARQKLDHETETYYAALAKSERQEEQQWDQIAAQAAHRLWE